MRTALVLALCGSVACSAPESSEDGVDGGVALDDAGAAADAGALPLGAFQIEVLQYNIGNGAARAGQNDVIGWLESGQRPDVITLNEVCGKRFNEIADIASPLGYAASFFATNSGGCGGSGAGLGYGNALLVLGTPLSPFESFAYANQEAGVEVRNMGCVRFSLDQGYQLGACVTHLENSSELARAQALEALNIATAMSAGLDGARIVVGGDFNLEPADPAIANWMSSPFVAGGLELPTHEDGKTIDYVFSTASGSSPQVRTEAGLSDHHAVWASIGDQ